jgi:hypothetical protein
MNQFRDNPYRRKSAEAPEKSRDFVKKAHDPRAPREARGGKKSKGGKPPGRPGVVKRDEGRRGLRELPREMAELAEGTVERLRRPRKPPAPIADERVGFVIAGVRNHDARQVFDARVATMRAAFARGDRATVGRGLCDARRMQLWRARNVIDFDAFADGLLGLSGAEAELLAQGAASEANVTLDALPEHTVALWLRLEAALTRTNPEAQVSVTGSGDALAFELKIPGGDIARVVEGFFDMGGAATGLRKFLRGGS